MRIFSMRLLGMAGAAVFAFALWAVTPSAVAQDDSTDEVFSETQELIDSIQEQLDRMAKRAEARDGDLESLARQIDEAAALLGDRGSENTSLRQKNAALSEEIGVAAVSQGELEEELRGAVSAREGVIVDLNARVVELEAQLTVERLGGDRLRDDVAGLTALSKTAAADTENLRSELTEARGSIAALTKDRSAATNEQSALIAALRTEVSGLKEVLTASHQDNAGLQRTYSTLEVQYREALAEKGDFEARLLEVRQSLEQESSVTEDRRRQNLALRQEIAALKGELDTRDQRLHELGSARSSAETDSANLSGILSDLRDQLQDIKFALETSEARVEASDDQVADLRNQLDAVLAEQYDELAVFRSLLFNRLRASLVERPGLRFVGESIVLQSDFLFASSSADMREGANAPLTTLARTLLTASRDAPIGLEWVLRVDGHTDSQPLNDGPFESNWALSAERARKIVQYLAGQGVSPERLAAVGFGEYRPVDPSGDEIAFRRNRRVEFHLVAR
ncbi:MAG: OmpA family protein [Proteobacteria bacterium]|nr:OmpA family protein [Pseudomonadota bacterium]